MRRPSLRRAPSGTHEPSFRFQAILVLSLAAFAAGQACTDPRDTEPHVPSRAGAFQPDGGGAPIGEAEACERVTEAEDDARSALGCAPAERADCPEYIRPPGANACFRYDEASVDGCVEFFGTLRSCSELDSRRCIVIAEQDESLPGCAQTGQGGAGGEGSSAGGAGGDVGAAGAGAGGTPAEGGAGGQGGG